MSFQNQGFKSRKGCFQSFLLFSTVALSGCSFKFQVTSQKTALENQILGEYWQLEDDLILSSTMRNEAGKKRLSKAEMAKQNQRFNHDDLEELKDAQILGEKRTGLVSVLPSGLGKSDGATSSQIDLAKTLAKEENRDRQSIWNHLIKSNKNLTRADLKELRTSYAIQKANDARVGHWIQNKSGQWKRKGAE